MPPHLSTLRDKAQPSNVAHVYRTPRNGGHTVQPRTLVIRADSGDLDAFTELVRCYQDTAFGFAFSILGDFHLAQDATQDAFVAAYFNLSSLHDPDRFAGWLRGIVRHQCSRILRKRRLSTLPLEGAREVAAQAPGPEGQAEQRDAMGAVLSEIMSLPEPQREVTILYYVREYSQAEIAAFLELPVTTVNNRLHAARKTLRGGLSQMARDTFNSNALPEDFAENVGKIVRQQGPIIDARFGPDTLPTILTELSISDGAGQPGITAHVAQHLGDGLVRAITVPPASGLSPGATVINTLNPAGAALSAQVLEEVVNALNVSRRTTEVLETGIKVIDLLCPYPRGGGSGSSGEPAWARWSPQASWYIA